MYFFYAIVSSVVITILIFLLNARHSENFHFIAIYIYIYIYIYIDESYEVSVNV